MTSVYLFVCVCVYVCMYIYLIIYTYMRKKKKISIYVTYVGLCFLRMRVCRLPPSWACVRFLPQPVCIHVSMCMRFSKQTQTHAFMHLYIYKCMHLYIYCMILCAHIYMNRTITYAYTGIWHSNTSKRFVGPWTWRCRITVAAMLKKIKLNWKSYKHVHCSNNILRALDNCANYIM